jgi:cytochrome P450 family 619
MCPGIHLAERNMWLGFAKLLWAFEFEAEDGAENLDVDPQTAYSEGFLVCAKNYGLKIRVRSEGRRETILRETEVARKEVFSRYPNHE